MEKIKYFLSLLILLLSLAHVSRATAIKQYRLSTGNAFSLKQGCLSYRVDVVFEDQYELIKFKLDSSMDGSIINIDPLFIQRDGNLHFYQIIVSSHYDTETILKFSVTNSIGSSKVFELTDTPIICQGNLFETIRQSQPFYDYSTNLITISLYVDPLYRPYYIKNCSSTWDSDFGTPCSMIPDQFREGMYVITINPSINKMATKRFTVTFMDVMDNTYSRPFNSPFNVTQLSSVTKIQHSYPSVDTTFSQTDYALNAPVVKYTTFKADAFFCYISDNGQDVPTAFIPVYGTPVEKSFIGYMRMVSGELTDRTYLIKGFHRLIAGNNGLIVKGMLTYDYVPAIKSPWEVSSNLFEDTTTLKMSLLESTVQNVVLGQVPIVSNFRGLQITHPYPYGFKKELDNSFSFTYDQMIGLSGSHIPFSVQEDTTHTTTSVPSLIAPINPLFKDTQPPELVSFTSKKLDSNTVVFSLHIKDGGSGVYMITLLFPTSNMYYAIDTLASGTLNDGVFDIIVKFTDMTDFYSSTPYLYIVDLASNGKYIDPLSWSLDFDKNKLTTVHDITIFDFIYIRFLYNSVDTSFGIKKNIVYFNLDESKVNKEIKPFIRIFEQTPSFSVNPISVFVGHYDISLGMYKIEFEIPQRQFSGPLLYSIVLPPGEFSSQELGATLGLYSVVQLTSDYGDNYPPMITDFTFTKGESIIIDPKDIDKEVEFGWNFKITDYPNGFEYGSLSISSDTDLEPRSFNITRDDIIDGYTSIVIKTKGGCRTQKFFISKATLYDSAGKMSSYPPSQDKLATLSPLLELNKDHTITVFSTCDNVDSVVPILVNFEAVYQDDIATFTIKVKDTESGISLSHKPYVFISSLFSEYIQVSSDCDANNCVADADGSVTFIATVQLPASYRYYGCIYSIYGITDNQLNINGYSSKELKTLGKPYSFKETTLPKPEITSISSISDMGGFLTVSGTRFSPQSLVAVRYDSMSSAVVNLTPVFVSSNLIVVEIAPLTSKVYVYIHSSGIQSNIFEKEISKTLKSSFVYVDPTSACDQDCGSIKDPFKSIKQALAESPSTVSILLQPGIYSGRQNNQVLINDYREIYSVGGPYDTIIDCQGYGFGIKVLNSKRFSLSGVSIKNCRSKIGGALMITNSSVHLHDVQFVDNYATDGAAIYISRKDLVCTNCVFKNNKVIHNGAAIYAEFSNVQVKGYLTDFFPKDSSIGGLSSNVNGQNFSKDMFCKNSTFKIDSAILQDTFDFECSNCDSNYAGAGQPLCLDKNIEISPIYQPDICVEDSCLTNPGKCSCYFSGMVFETFAPGCNATNISLCESMSQRPMEKVAIDNHMGGFKNVVNRFYGYLSVSKDNQVDFLFSGSNFGFIFKVNGLKQLSMNQNTKFNQTVSVYLPKRHIHFIEIVLFSSISKGSQRSFSMTPLIDINDEMFYSNLICGDKINNPLESNPSSPFYCESDHKYPLPTGTVKCGDGICNDEFPDKCFQDCYQELTKKCPTRTVPDGHISPGFMLGDDSIGNMVSNQFVWQLPGSAHLTFGVDIVTGEEGDHPIFQFDYCEHIAPRVIEDVYRGKVYLIPSDFDAKSLPECTYSTSTESHSSSTDIQSKMQNDTSAEFEASAGGGFMGVSGSVNVAYSQEKSVLETKKMETSSNHKVFKTDLYCKTSFVSIDTQRASKHPHFLSTLATVKNMEDMLPLVKRYGTHYYTSTYLGGKLSQVTVVDTSLIKTSDDTSLSESSSASLAASINSPSFSVGASTRATLDKSNSKLSQSENNNASDTSKIMTYGGAPAAFSQARDKLSSPTYYEWTDTIDLLPVPIDYQLAPISKLINENWMNAYSNERLINLWNSAVNYYYLLNNYEKVLEDTAFTIVFQVDVDTSGIGDGIYHTYPTLEITFYDASAVATTINVDLPYQHYDTAGQKLRGLYTRSKNTGCTTYSAFNRDLSPATKTTITECDDGIADSLGHPIMLNFNSADFFGSSKKPEIKLTFLINKKQVVFKDTVKIISWDRNQAIVFDANKEKSISVYDDPQQYYLTIAFENRFAWHTTKNYLALNMDHYNNEIDCSRKFTSGICEDEIEFSFTGSKPNSASDPRPVPSDTKPPSQHKYIRPLKSKPATIQWSSFTGTHPPDMSGDKPLMVSHLSNIGMQTRVHWVKLYLPTGDAKWLNDIFSYHLKGNQEPTMTSAEFVEVNFVENKLDRFSPYKWLPLNPFTQVNQPRYLYYYHNFNFPAEGVKSYPINSIFSVRTYGNVLSNGSPKQFISKDGSIYSF